MNAILVDDEPLALRKLEKMLKKFEDIHVSGCYQIAPQAIEQIQQVKPDVVFLDIHMPGINGLEMAERINQASPHTNIVFITAHDSHAIHAFELTALDYLLKPVSQQRLSKSIERIRENLKRLDNRASSAPSRELLTLHCLGKLCIQWPGQPPEPLKWRTTKAKDVFCYLFHHRGQLVNRDVLIDLFWPELEEHNAAIHLQTTIYRIRNLWKGLSKSLAPQEELVSIKYVSRGYCLELNEHIRVDAAEWERRVSALEPISAANVDEYRQLVDKYEGHYLGADYKWAKIERHRLAALWLQQAQQLGEYYERQGLLSECLSIYRKVLYIDPLREENHFRLMKIYAKLSDFSSVRNQFAALQEMLAKEVGVSPSQEVLNWYEEWSRRRRAVRRSTS
ncbi:response regulator [Paenibacillus senegalensis]|uniref:response regulator n=1 Tax=Paenibacillus senegalensis TaxID=1465766 RepID=UPI000289CE71|nr:response regulator [Paenibacillus senegalensis]